MRHGATITCKVNSPPHRRRGMLLSIETIDVRLDWDGILLLIISYCRLFRYRNAHSASSILSLTVADANIGVLLPQDRRCRYIIVNRVLYFEAIKHALLLVSLTHLAIKLLIAVKTILFSFTSDRVYGLGMMNRRGALFRR